MAYKLVVLAILDGWGVAPDGSGNAISQAKTPNMTRLWTEYTHTQLIAHGESVGLPKREPGNTETGHLNIGAGRIVYQDLPRINMAIADGSFFQNETILAAINHARNNNSRLHLMGLIGGGAVHSDISHLFTLLRLCREQQFTNVYIHLFTDGRDSPPSASMTYINQLKETMAKEKVGTIATVMGRYFAMDRDFRWDRTQKAYLCLTQGQGHTAKTIDEAITQSYAADKTDEFIEPTVIDPSGIVKPGDSVIFYNFRIDRPRQLTKAFVLSDFEQTANVVGFDPFAVKYLKHHEDSHISDRQKPFDRGPQIADVYFVTLTEYEQHLPAPVAFPPRMVEDPLGKVLADNKTKQVRICESEKERFVTYYFNGQREEAFDNEDRIIVPSSRIATYDLKPEMAAIEVKNQVLSEIHSGLYQVIIINFANPDMVGHTGNLKATIKACEVVDVCIGEIASAVETTGGVLLISADHGNAEEMINRTTSEIDTEHNANPVPFIVVGTDFKNAKQLSQGILADIAPTILGLLGIRPSSGMNGRNLLS